MKLAVFIKIPGINKNSILKKIDIFLITDYTYTLAN